MERLVADAKKNLKGQLEKYPVVNDRLRALEKQTGIAPVHGFLPAVTLLAVLAWALCGGVLLVTLICFAYPACAAARDMGNMNSEERARWLTYWIIFAALSTMENVFPSIVARIPLYAFIKLMVLAWCYNDRTRGASVIYEMFLQPVMVQFSASSLGSAVRSPTSGGARAEASSSSGGGGGSGSSGGEGDGVGGSGTLRPGVLTVKVVSASGLPAVDATRGKTDPFCLLRLGPAGGRSRSAELVENTWNKTNSKYNSLDPKWNEIVTLQPVTRLDTALEIECRHRQVIGGGDSIVVGAIDPIPLRDLTDGTEVDVVRPLRRPGGEAGGGELRLVLRLRAPRKEEEDSVAGATAAGAAPGVATAAGRR